MTVSEQISYALSHPLVSAHIDASAVSDAYSTEQALEDLAQWGAVTLSNTGRHAVWRCELTLADTTELAARDHRHRGEGETQQLATLRCLMEALTMFDRNERRLHHQLHAVLSDGNLRAPAHGRPVYAPSGAYRRPLSVAWSSASFA